MYKNIVTQTLRKPLFKTRGLSLDVLRLDKIHRHISGNKWYKLKYHTTEALRQGKTGIVTFGGAYSNHLVATAVACKEQHLKSVGILRGEQTFPENNSIVQMKEAGMELIYVNREEYKNKEQLITPFIEKNNEYYYVPEGGQSDLGVKGAGEILSEASDTYTHIICAVGTGTTLAGIINASGDGQTVIGTCALKIPDQNDNEIDRFIRSITTKRNWSIDYDHHFGGYAKKTTELIAFMNSVYQEENIPTDFVYTAKMFYAVYDMAAKDLFQRGSKLLMIHTGGLQGNRSLPEGTLIF